MTVVPCADARESADLLDYQGAPLGALSHSQEHSLTTTTTRRRCAREDCQEAAETRKGPTGPHPRWCAEHAKARKRWQDNGGSRAREPYRECCKAYQANGGHGKCPQCKVNRDYDRDFRQWWDGRFSSRSDEEADYLLSVFGAADGFHMERPMARSDEGPYEGRTYWSATNPAREVLNANPCADAEASAWYENNENWNAHPVRPEVPVKPVKPEAVRILRPSEMRAYGFRYDDVIGWYLDDPEKLPNIVGGQFNYA